MIKKAICTIFISCFAISAFAADTTDAIQKQIAENCKPYLMPNTVPQHLSEHANAALKACYDNNSCTNDALLDVDHCTKKLLNWESSYDLPTIPATTQKKTTKKTHMRSTQTKKTKTPSALPNAATPAPINLNDDTTTPPAHHDKTQQQKKPSINWF